jgi:hypothetical protein
MAAFTHPLACEPREDQPAAHLGTCLDGTTRKRLRPRRLGWRSLWGNTGPRAGWRPGRDAECLVREDIWAINGLSIQCVRTICTCASRRYQAGPERLYVTREIWKTGAPKTS